MKTIQPIQSSLLYRNAPIGNLTLRVTSVRQVEQKILQNRKVRDLPGGAVVKNPPANAGDKRSSPRPGRSHMPWSN